MTQSVSQPSRKGCGLPTVLLLTIGVQALATLSVLSLATLAPVAMARFHLGVHFVGYQISVIFASAALVSLIAGLLVLRWGAIATSQYAMVLCAAGVLCLSAGNLLFLIIGSLLMGAGYGLTNPAASHLLHSLASVNHRNLLFSLKQTAVPLGGVVAGLMLPPLAAVAGWRSALLACACLSATLFFALSVFRPRFDLEHRQSIPFKENVRSDLRMLYKRKDLLRLSVMAICYSAAQLSLTSFAVAMLVQDLNKSHVLAGSIFSLILGCGVFGRIFWGIVADRLRSGVPVLFATGILTVFLSLTMVTVDQQWPLAAIIALLCLFGICAIGWNGVFLAEVARISNSEDVGSMTGMVLCFTFAGVIVGPAAFSTTYIMLGSYTATYGAMAILPLIGILSLLGFREEL